MLINRFIYILQGSRTIVCGRTSTVLSLDNARHKGVAVARRFFAFVLSYEVRPSFGRAHGRFYELRLRAG
jgi:hypothetical protein